MLDRAGPEVLIQGSWDTVLTSDNDTRGLSRDTIQHSLTLMGRSSSGFLKRSHIMPMIARATHSQLKKLKKLMMEKMSLEKAYIRVITH